MNIRKAAPDLKAEMWGVKEIAEHLKCDKMKAEKTIKEIRATHNVTGYGDVPREWVMDYIREKERIERERDARYKSDLSNVERIAILKEQVNTLKEQVKALDERTELARQEAQSSSKAALRANTIAIVAIVVSALATLAATILQLVG